MLTTFAAEAADCMNLLIVDDRPLIRDGVRRLLSANADLSVCDTASSREALAIFRSRRPDGVLLDVNLGHCGGLELLRCVLGEDAGARVLLFSMSSEPLDVSRAFKAGPWATSARAPIPMNCLPRSTAWRKAAIPRTGDRVKSAL